MTIIRLSRLDNQMANALDNTRELRHPFPIGEGVFLRSKGSYYPNYPNYPSDSLPPMCARACAFAIAGGEKKSSIQFRGWIVDWIIGVNRLKPNDNRSRLIIQGLDNHPNRERNHPKTRWIVCA